MFTGIIEHLGRVTAVAALGRGKILTMDTGSLASGMKAGDSIAVSGACLTATRIAGGKIEVEVTAETVSKTTLGRLAPGSLVNLERPLAAGGRLHGHLVQGHVDATTRIDGLQKGPGSVVIGFALPESLRKYIVPKGSVAVDGVSLTVAGLDRDSFSCSLVGYTLEHTTFGQARVGTEVNLETDIIGKYVAAMLESWEPLSGGLSIGKLRDWGY